MALITTVITEKGGAGKTTVTLGLASAAADARRRVLVVDFDPQGSATHVLGVTPDAAEGAVVAALEAPRPGGASAVVVASAWDGVDVLPATRALRSWSPEGNARARAGRLARALKGAADGYDHVLIDTAPGLGELAVNALAASQRALLIAEPAALSIAAIEPVADLIDDVWQRFNPDLDLAGVVLNRVPAQSLEAERQTDALGRIVGRRTVWKPFVPQRVVLNQAAGEGRPIHAYGTRAGDLPSIFDKLLRRLERTAA